MVNGQFTWVVQDRGGKIRTVLDVENPLKIVVVQEYKTDYMTTEEIKQSLRIGNWMSVSGKYGQIAELLVNVFSFKHGYAFESYDYIQPIPLTEQILLKCRFEKSPLPNWDYFKRVSALNLNARKGGDNIYFELGDIYLGDSNLKYLHQLQNIYYSLTGKELTVNI